MVYEKTLKRTILELLGNFNCSLNLDVKMDLFILFCTKYILLWQSDFIIYYLYVKYYNKKKDIYTEKTIFEKLL